MVGGGPRKEVKLLVVDDHVDHFEHLQAFADMYSSQFSIECKLAQGVREASELVDSWKPSVVLLDVHMDAGGAVGLELIEEMSHRGAAVIALSEVRIPAMAATAESYGAVGYFRKSDNPDDIEALIGFIASVATTTVVSH